MARAALNWSLGQLAEAAGVHRNTISNFETGRYGGDPEKLTAIKSALERAGVVFVEENGHGPGARLRHSVHTEEGSQRLLFRKYSAPLPPGRWDIGRPLFDLPKLAKYNAEGWFVLDEPSDEDRERAARWYPNMQK